MTICLSQEGSWRLWTVLLRELSALMWDLTYAFSNLKCLCMHTRRACMYPCVRFCVCPHCTYTTWPTHNKKKRGKGETENAMTTQSSDVNLVELVLSTVQRGSCSLPFPTVTPSSTPSSVNFSEYRAVCHRRPTPYRRSGMYWKLCSCSSWSLDHGYSMFTSSILLGEET